MWEWGAICKSGNLNKTYLELLHQRTPEMTVESNLDWDSVLVLMDRGSVATKPGQ